MQLRRNTSASTRRFWIAWDGSHRLTGEKNPEGNVTHGKVWPAHPKPLPEELLTSWIVRVAAANGIKLQTLCWMLFGNGRSPWNRDIDRNAPPWLIKAMGQHTGINYWDVFHTSLVTYRTRLYPRRQAVGQLRWILPIRSSGMWRTAFGQQFCPRCLASDVVPYFRKQWRVSVPKASKHTAMIARLLAAKIRTSHIQFGAYREVQTGAEN